MTTVLNMRSGESSNSQLQHGFILLRVQWLSSVTELIMPNKTSINFGQNIEKQLFEGIAE